MYWMGFEQHMQSIVAPITVRVEDFVLPINVFVSATGAARIAVWSCVPMHVLAMETVKETNVLVRRGKCYFLKNNFLRT